VAGLTDLTVWKQAVDFRRLISHLVSSFPKDEKYRLADQLIRSSRSCAANIAEGYGRYHYQENIQFCRQARGSYYESFEHLHCAQDEKYISEEQFTELSQKIEMYLKTLNGYIDFLEKQKATNKDRQK
jgi:four helix bundle protein